MSDEHATPPQEPDPDGPGPAPADEPTREAPRAAPADAAPADDDPLPPAAPGPQGLHRSADERLVFGVCGGIAERYGFEPLLVRLLFLATFLIGGAGVLVYLAAAVLIPVVPGAGQGGATQNAPAVDAATGVLRLLVGLAVVIAAFAGLSAVAGVSFVTTVVLGAWPVGVVLLVVAGLLVATLSRRRVTAALLLLALALAVPATAAVVADVDVDRSFGRRDLRPSTVADAERPHRLGMGRMTLDLRRTPTPRERELNVRARVDVGELAVALPRDRCVAWTVRTSVRTAGDSEVLTNFYNGEPWTGGGPKDRTVRIDPPRGAKDRRPRATLDLRVGVGSLVVADSLRGADGDGLRGVGLRDRDGDVLRTDACRRADRAARR